MSRKAVIESIEKNAMRLVEDNRRLRRENERLAASRDRLRGENSRLAAENTALERSLAIKELAEGFAGEGAGGATMDRRGAKTARARVNRLMREVDRCIALVNRDL